MTSDHEHLRVLIANQRPLRLDHVTTIVAGLGHEPELNTQAADKDVVKLRFVDAAEVASSELAEFLREHYAAVAETSSHALSPSFRRATAAKSV